MQFALHPIGKVSSAASALSNLIVIREFGDEYQDKVLIHDTFIRDPPHFRNNCAVNPSEQILHSIGQRYQTHQMFTILETG